MRSFEDWFAENYPFESSMKDGGSLWFKENMGKAWDYRQTEVDELQKRVDAVKRLIQTYKDEENELELKEWEQSTIYGRIAIELEQALKGGGE